MASYYVIRKAENRNIFPSIQRSKGIGYWIDTRSNHSLLPFAAVMSLHAWKFCKHSRQIWDFAVQLQ